jgi:hypothetical protein
MKIFQVPRNIIKFEISINKLQPKSTMAFVKSPEVLMRMGLRMVEQGNYECGRMYLSRVDLKNDREGLQARIIANYRTRQMEHAFRDVQRYMSRFGNFVERRNKEFNLCLIDTSMSMGEYQQAARILWIIMKSDKTETYMRRWAKCMYNLEYYHNTILAISEIADYEDSHRLKEMMEDCEKKILQGGPDAERIWKPYTFLRPVEIDVEKEAKNLLDFALDGK